MRRFTFVIRFRCRKLLSCRRISRVVSILTIYNLLREFVANVSKRIQLHIHLCSHRRSNQRHKVWLVLVSWDGVQGAPGFSNSCRRTNTAVVLRKAETRREVVVLCLKREEMEAAQGRHDNILSQVSTPCPVSSSPSSSHVVIACANLKLNCSIT